MSKLFAIVLSIFVICQNLSADNWPQWRGARLDSVSDETGLPNSFNEKNRLWRIELPGPGGASPVVWQDKIFVASVEGQDLVLLCVGTNGKLKWKQKLEGENSKGFMDNSNSASSSPVTDGENVWVMLSPGILHCFDMDGSLVWKKNMQAEYGRFRIQFGMSSTPVFHNGRLYFQFIHGNMRNDSPSVGTLVALDAKSGDEVWVHTRKTNGIAENKHAYTSPTIFQNGNLQFLVVHGADYVTGHNLKDGSEIWRVGGFNPQSTYNKFLRFVSSPVCTKDMIVVPSAKNGPVFALEPGLSGTIKQNDKGIRWKLKRGTPDVASPVVSEDRVFLARENGVFMCLDAKTGAKLYEERVMTGKHRSTPVVADGKVFVIARDGNALVFADDKEFKVISEHDLGEDTTASPAISNGRIYIRTNKSLMAFGK